VIDIRSKHLLRGKECRILRKFIIGQPHGPNFSRFPRGISIDSATGLHKAIQAGVFTEATAKREIHARLDTGCRYQYPISLWLALKLV
jgi:hypothetical protein